MSEEDNRDRKVLLYLKLHGILEIGQVTPEHREMLYAILDGRI